MSVVHNPVVPLRFAVVGNPENRRMKLFATILAGLRKQIRAFERKAEPVG